MPEIVLEDFVAPEAAPHEYQPVIMALIEAGPSKVATAVFDTEDEAVTYVKQMQVAARQLSMSALKRALAVNADGKYSASVSVRAKITRDRSNTGNAEAVVEAPAKATKATKATK